jgi:hypothetical protein
MTQISTIIQVTYIKLALYLPNGVAQPGFLCRIPDPDPQHCLKH